MRDPLSLKEISAVLKPSALARKAGINPNTLQAKFRRVSTPTAFWMERGSGVVSTDQKSKIGVHQSSIQ